MYNIGAQGTNVAIMTYNNRATLHTKLPYRGSSSSQSLTTISQDLDRIRYTGGGSANIDKPLEMAAAQVFPDNRKSREVKKVCWHLLN